MDSKKGQHMSDKTTQGTYRQALTVELAQPVKFNRPPLSEEDVTALLSAAEEGRRFDLAGLTQALRDLSSLRRWTRNNRVIACGQCGGQLDARTAQEAAHALLDTPDITMPFCLACSERRGAPVFVTIRVM